MEHGQETMTIVDEQGNEHVCEVILTFESKDYGKSYVLYHVLGKDNDETEEIEIHASSFIPNEDGEEDGELMPIEDDKEWEMVEETLNAFLGEEEEED
ncbi:DUF1292 domain-containing protein [Sporosarcina pasteurii]|uniref:UPF0473 protein NCTC4822_01461 n=1 Tax=Sporosarcina pasteurii TaxID=1474 RepID=A0A380BMC4_SPOPA|nr:DUF1292 domain-containing protein [Sporosarcina pasteurii]MDS9470986.1 DUF1292 domain-containing protein [Sporosarcina pasteurii]QBQ05364.1 DUF1292 domain-containing protein [Sporosarcina pasteurii]SUJ03607.1 Uncharacterized protein conserved in bacteria [Sporosarcina pasteurii]